MGVDVNHFDLLTVRAHQVLEHFEVVAFDEQILTVGVVRLRIVCGVGY